MALPVSRRTTGPAFREVNFGGNGRREVHKFHTAILRKPRTMQVENAARDSIRSRVGATAVGHICSCKFGEVHFPVTQTETQLSMLILMQCHATEAQIRAVCERIESLGLKAHPIPGSLRTAIGITGNKGSVDLGVLESMAGVVECIPVSKPYKLVS